MAPPSANDIAVLDNVANSIAKLISDLVAHIESQEKQSPTLQDPENANIASIAVAHDAATLIKAHCTKISLLIINEPFTPTAIVKVLREILDAALPSLASAASACEPARYTAALSHELRFRCRRVLRTLRDLVDLIPRDGKILTAVQKDGSKDGKGSITVTSIIWAACDDVIKLRSLGVKGLLSEKINQHSAILDDIREELREWKEENEDVESADEDEDEEPCFDEELADDPQAQLDELMSAQKIPKDRTDIRSQLGPCITRLGLLGLLFKAIVKRRIKEVPDFGPTGARDGQLGIVTRINEVYPILKGLPDDFGELVAAFYKLDAPLVESTRAQCFRQACSAGQLFRKPWTGNEDSFSTWLDKFQSQMDAPTHPKA